MQANGTHASLPKWLGVVILAGAFLALCTAFVALITAFEAWQEHVQASWPAATAKIKYCQVNSGYSQEKYVYIVCLIRIVAEQETIEASVSSRKTRAPEEMFFSWPKNQVGNTEMQSWVDDHPAGTSMQVRVNPDQHNDVVLVGSNMPLGDAKTPGNVRLLEFFAAISAPILTIGLILGRRYTGPDA